MTDRREGPTPAGGDYSEAVYLDHEGREVEPERATQIVIRELDREGRLVAETWGTIERSRPTPRRIVAERGQGRYVIVETDERIPDRDPSGPAGRIYDRVARSVSAPLLIAAIAGRGYWREWESESSETDEAIVSGFERALAGELRDLPADAVGPGARRRGPSL